MARSSDHEPPGGSPPAARPDPLLAVPQVADGVEARADSRGRIQLRRRMDPGRGMAGLLTRRLKFERVARVNLDEAGSRFWHLIDGLRTIEEIADAMAGETGTDADACRRATVEFTRSLVLRHFVVLRVPAGPA